MPTREQTIAGKSFRVIRDISSDLPGILPIFNSYNCIVIISKYNTGKSTSATNTIFKHFGFDFVEYITLTEQRKGTDRKYRKSSIKFGEVPENKIVVFDELHSDIAVTSDAIHRHIKELIEKNKLIILTNPYGLSSDSEKEIGLFVRTEIALLPENTLIVFVTNIYK